MAVPTVFLNGQPFGQGRMTIEEIVARLDVGAEKREAEKISAKAPSTCSLSAAARRALRRRSTRRARASVPACCRALRRPGALDTLAIENFISVKETDGPKLAAGLESTYATTQSTS